MTTPNLVKQVWSIVLLTSLDVLGAVSTKPCDEGSQAEKSGRQSKTGGITR